MASTKELLQSVERASLISRDGKDNVIKWTISEVATMADMGMELQWICGWQFFGSFLAVFFEKAVII